MKDTTLKTTLMTLVLTLVSFGLPATELAETLWTSPDLGLQMQLRSDGSYTFSGPGGTSTGVFQFNGQFLLMQDGSSGQQSVYGLSQPSPETLVLTDPSGASIQMQAQQPGTQHPKPQEPAESTPQAKILATAQGKTLSTGEMQVGYDLAELIIDQRLSEAEKDRLIAASIQEFSADPGAFLSQIDQLRSSMQQIDSIQDPFMLGLARQMLFAQFYLATESIPSEQIPELIRVMREHLRVVAVDRPNQLLLTDRDIDAMVAYNAFLSRLNGVDANPYMGDRSALEHQLQQDFASLALESKKTLAAIYPVWQATQYSWAQMTDQQRQQVILQMRQRQQQQSAATNQWNQKWDTEGESEWSKTSNGKMALEMMRSANNARIMSAVIDTNSGFTACLTCSPGINPYN